MSQKLSLSVIIITRDEERDIKACLESVKTVADEIIVVDSGSKDRTIEICKQYGSKVLFHEWSGYAAQKQFALENASESWVLNIDADERLTMPLQQEIRDVLANNPPAVNAFHIPFHTFFLGERLRFGRSSGESHVRLFRRGRARYGIEQVHEGIKVEGALGRLTQAIEHHSYHDIYEYLKKCNEYTSTIAEAKYERGARFHLWHHLRLPYEFLVRYILKGGFLDGNAGLVYALLSSYYVWLKYVKLKDVEKAKS